MHIPVRPGESEIAGLRTDAALADIPGAVDLVVVFRTPGGVSSHVEEAAAKRAERSGFLPARGARLEAEQWLCVNSRCAGVGSRLDFDSGRLDGLFATSVGRIQRATAMS
jgi:hypothetical protein